MDIQPDLVIKNASLSAYDRSMPGRLQREYYGGSGFFNFGYWTKATGSQREASENLVSNLIEMIPRKTGTILDVACGMGATTEMLLAHYRAADVFGVNISPQQLSLARERAGGCGFVAMDATKLAFEDERFDNVICVEAAFHFATRTDFLREAYRVLKPGGTLVHSDILQSKAASRTGNFLDSPGALAGNLEAAGFTDVNVLDRTEECFRGFVRNIRAWPRQEREAGRIGLARYAGLSLLGRAFAARLERRIRFYTLSSARKPGL